MEQKRNDAIEEARRILRKQIPRGKEVYTQIVKVSRSGMMRTIKVFIVHKGKIENISWKCAVALDWKGSQDGLKVSGCGMDMTYHTVNSLSYVLGYATGTPDGKTNCYGLNHINL